MESQLNKIMQFVENGGRFCKGVEPKYGEPYYDDYMEQYISENFTPGDKIHVKTDSAEFNGILLDISWKYLCMLTAGRKVYKGERNKKEIRCETIKEITCIKKASDTFDLAAVDYNLWKQKQLQSQYKHTKYERCESEYKRRDENKVEFNRVYPDVDFDKSHVIRFDYGINMYFPFNCEKITADIVIMHGYNCISKVTCKAGTPFPNKNCFHAYNSKETNLWCYLPDNGFIYENINIVCIWTATVNELAAPLKFLAIHHFDKILPVKNDENLIVLDLLIYPLLGYGKSLFTTDSKSLCKMMDKDLYCILYPKDYSATIVKQPETIESERLEDLLYTATLAIKDFGFTNSVETFCNIDTEADQCFSDLRPNDRKFFKFKKLEENHNICAAKE